MSTHRPDLDASSGRLARLFSLLGNLVLLVFALQIFHGGARFSGLDAVYWVIVGVILAARYADICCFQAMAAERKRVSLEDWRRYAFVVVPTAGAGWLAVHALGGVGFSF
jgi:hypothetical protein